MRRLQYILLALVGIGTSQASQAVSYDAGLENSQWYLASSVFECALHHPIPGFGQGVFYHEAGESVRFYLEAPRSPLRAGQAALVIEAPVWRPGSAVSDLGYVTVTETHQPVQVDSQRTSVMMDSLLVGMSPTITRQARYTQERVKVALSPISFNRVYPDYLLCVDGLLPMNFRQAERSVLLFAPGAVELSDSARQRLDDLILYIKADASVTRIIIDGHSDSFGPRMTNRELSRQRAEAVARYLADAGVNEAMMTVRFHGDRIPVVDNKTEANRARNRRVTVRLERSQLDWQPSQVEALPAAPQY